MSATPAVIAFESVSKAYDGGRVMALDDVTLDVAPGEFLSVVGPSGSGKTTLLRMVNRLSEPTAGAVRFDGDDVREIDSIALRRRIGYVFQGVGLFPHMTVAENITITPRLLGWEGARSSARVEELLHLVRLPPETYRHRMPHQLSGGESQRVGVARALAAGPRVVLMDEPFGALDPLTRDAVAMDYRRLHDELGLTTMMITHDIVEAVLLADRLAVLHAGRLAEQGTPRTLMSGARDPYVRELMRKPREQAERLARAVGGR